MVGIKIIVYGERQKLNKNPKIYNVWKTMRSRCNNPNSKKYPRYGGRGISICAEWNEYMEFQVWAIKSGYKTGLSIDRIDNNGNYEPSNCRWATSREQQRNTSRSCVIEYDGIRLSAPEWAEITGISEKLITQRKLMGWNAEKILTAPSNPHQRPVEAIRDGLVVAMYLNISQAAKATGAVDSHISACLNAKRKHAGGYCWREADSN